MTAPRLLLALASVAVAIAAADTYVVVLALPDMMATVGIPIEELQRAAPLISGFLLGYVAMLPMIGRIADLEGRIPVLLVCLAIFAAGSLITTVSFDLPLMVSGRFIQGLGGGGLVPATLALVADLYPPQRRGVPLGMVSAVQELGSVLGPLFGAAIVARWPWQVIFALNVVAGLVLALAIAALARRRKERRPGLPDLFGIALLALSAGALMLLAWRPRSLYTDLTWGELWVSLVGTNQWATPLGLTAIGALVAFLVRSAYARRPVFDVRRWGRAAQRADLPGSLLLAAALAGIIVAFATADPEVEVFAPAGKWFLLVSGLASVAFVWHLRRAAEPVIPRGLLSPAPAWSAIVVSFFIGAALIAALIDVPIFARTTKYPDSQVDAALVLVQFLVALPIGALIGGYALRWLRAGVVTALGMVLTTVGFWLMAGWDLNALDSFSSSATLAVTGLGFGLALAPINAAILATVNPDGAGTASSLVVVARMVGMLVGISVLTTLGLRRFYAERDSLPQIGEVCERGSVCSEYTTMVQAAALTQQHTVFLGAAVCAAIAGVFALIFFRTAETRDIPVHQRLG